MTYKSKQIVTFFSDSDTLFLPCGRNKLIITATSESTFSVNCGIYFDKTLITTFSVEISPTPVVVWNDVVPGNLMTITPQPRTPTPVTATFYIMAET